MVAGEFRKQVHGLFLHLMYNIDHRAIAVTHNGNDAVGEFNRLWFTGQQTRTFTQPLNGNHFNARFLQTFSEPKVIHQALEDKIAQAPAFLKHAPVVLNVSALEDPVNWSAMHKAVSATGLRVIGVSGCKDAQLKAEIEKMGLPILTEGKEKAPRPAPAPQAADLMHHQRRIIGSWVTSLFHMEKCAHDLTDWKLWPRNAITHRFSLEQAGDAYALMASGKCGKVVINFPD